MPKIEVYCTVQNCDYWGENNQCLAEKILIVSDAQAAQWPDQYDAPMATSLEQAHVGNCMQTACKTFRLQHSQAGPVQDLRNQDPYLAGKYPHQQQPGMQKPAP